MVGRIRPETEHDRTQAAVERPGFSLPLAHGDVEIAVERAVAETPVAQRIVSLLINELARMGGVVATISVVVDEVALQPAVPLIGRSLGDGLRALVDGLQDGTTKYPLQLRFGPASRPTVRIGIGSTLLGDLVVGADGWRALFGSATREADWHARPPLGAALAASLVAVEALKIILADNGPLDPTCRRSELNAYSMFNYGVDQEAKRGPDVGRLVLTDLVVTGCGAGGSATLYVLALHPELAGQVALIEPARHKLSNINRYLMTSASDVREERHKLSSATNHLARFAPNLDLRLVPRSWEELSEHPLRRVVSTVDTVEARWSIQDRSDAGAEILDGAVIDLLYSVARIMPGGWCLECKHPYDADLSLKQRAARWGVSVEQVRTWQSDNVPVSAAMVEQMAAIQGRPANDWGDLVGLRFRETPALTECGETRLRTDVPSQAPVLPMATTLVGTVIAAEVVKQHVAGDASLNNWLAHDVARAPSRPRLVRRVRDRSCPRHDDE